MSTEKLGVYECPIEVLYDALHSLSVAPNPFLASHAKVVGGRYPEPALRLKIACKVLRDGEDEHLTRFRADNRI